ncbi:flagellar biosynthetic protein FliQ [Arboricoccus pini]|uniref:Flagellar biosynthetic protein FliQ n=1 Tax=Arboricoccus pini TaxID=1963835 RepID=A0A212QV15_9PROT|nr:flagellar biosynthesis protein FliQ [Arboricoccus pini]SNB63492.1 flagellar biosynthetic protein FliQ [Arboricoccus pini]
MTAEQVIDLCRDMLWVTIMIGAPALCAALAVGLLVSLFQALTQIQEATLAFVPKVLAVCGVLVLTMPFALAKLLAFTQQIYGGIKGPLLP